MSRGRKSRGRREAQAARERQAAEPPPPEPAPPDASRPTPRRRALALLGRYDLLIVLAVGVAVAVYLGLSAGEDAVPAPEVAQPGVTGVTTGPEDPPDPTSRDGEGRGPGGDGPASPEKTFAHSCGTCHALRAAGTEGITGPDLDQVQPSKAQVLRFIRAGSLDGVMPPNLLRGERAEQVAEYVARTAGGG